MSIDDASLPEVVLYTRAGCHLCDEAKEQIRQVQALLSQGFGGQAQAPFAFREVDIDLDPDLLKRYNEEVPVVFINGKKAFKYRVDPRQLLKRLGEAVTSD